MLAPWKRGSRSARASLRSAAASAMIPGALLLVGLSQTGCDTEVAKADKALAAAVEKSGEKAVRTKTDAEPVSSQVQKAPIAEPQKAVAALTPLSTVDMTKPETLGEWKAAERGLSIRQREAIATALRAVSIEDRKALIAALEEAAKTAGTSPEAQVDPLLRVATLEAAAGDAIAREAAAKEVEAARLVEEIHRLLAQIKLNNSRVAAYNLKKPDAIEAEIDKLKTTIAGTAPDSNWLGSGDAVMPAGTRIDAEAAKAQADLDAAKAERQQKVDEATKLRQDAAGLVEEAKKDSGQIAYDKLIDASKKNQQAMMLDLDVSAIDTRIMNAEHQLQIAAARKPVVQAGVALLDRRKQEEADRWKTTQDLAALVTDETKKVVNGGGAAPATGPVEVTLTKPGDGPASQPTPLAGLTAINADNNLASKLEQLRQTVAVADELRGRAADMYQAALKHLKDAREAATGATKALKDQLALLAPKAPDRVSFENRIDLLDESRFAYREAEIRQRLARVYADQAIGIATRANLRAAAIPVLQAAGIDPAPEAVTALPQPADVTTAGKRADGGQAPDYVFGYADAIKALDPFFTGEGGSEAPFAELQKTDSTRGILYRAAQELMINMGYARSRVLAIVGDGSAGDKLTAAVGYANRYKTNYENALPRRAPEEIYAKLGVALATQPTLRPATLPTTPATGPTTEPSTDLFNPDGTPKPPPATTPAPAPSTTAPPGTPADWTRQDFPGTTVGYFAPPTWAPAPPAGITLMHSNTPTDAAVSFADAGTAAVTNIAGSVTNYAQVSLAQVMLNGTPASELVYTGSNPEGAAMKGLMYFMRVGDQDYQVNFIADPATFDANVALFRQIAGTLQTQPAGAAPAPAPAPAPTDTTTPAPPPPPSDNTTPPPPPPGQ